MIQCLLSGGACVRIQSGDTQCDNDQTRYRMLMPAGIAGKRAQSENPALARQAVAAGTLQCVFSD